MNEPKQTSFIDPSYRRQQARVIAGVPFHNYHMGILKYALISDDGQIQVWCANTHRDDRGDRGPTYFAAVVGHGGVKNPSGNPKRFRSEVAACRAAVKVRDR